MTSVVSERPVMTSTRASQRANELADRLDEGARALATLASGLTDAEWRTPLPHDGRPIGVVVHHVASMYPLEINLALQMASGTAITGVAWADVDAINAGHAREFGGVTKDEALNLLRVNSAAASQAIRALSDEQLDRALPISLYGDAILTCQFMLEDHAVRHSVHHLARIRKALGK